MAKIKTCSIWLLEFISLRKIFTLVCSALTLFLVFNLLFTFAVTKPTTTYKEEKELESRDLPEIVVCADPVFKLEVLEKYGYKSGDVYFVGDVIGEYKNFSGWNGEANVQYSSHEILEESLVIDTDDTLWGWEPIQFVGYYYVEGWPNYTSSMISQRTLVYPHGRCISFIPSAPLEKTHTVQNSFYIEFHQGPLKNSNLTTLRVFLMDKTSSVRLYPDITEMVGDMITLDLASPKVFGYNTHIPKYRR